MTAIFISYTAEDRPVAERLAAIRASKCWDPLLKASACGHLGRIEDGQASVRALLTLKPDFQRRGRSLIGKYIKFKDISNGIIKGLGKLGLEIA